MTELMTAFVRYIGLVPTIVLVAFIDFYLIYKMFDWLGMIDHFTDEKNDD